MTLCIAARSTADDSIVAVSDRMISFGWVSGEMGAKQTFVGPRWRALVAGEDISPVLPLIRRVRDYLDPLLAGHEPIRTLEDELRLFRRQTLEAVTRAFAQAYQEELKLVATDRHLGRYGLSMDEFRRVGASQFGEAEFRRLNRRIQATKLGLEFLVYGFDHGDLPHIFGVRDPGEITYHDYYGFAAIGSGETIAFNALMGNLPAATRDLVYRTCEAKFLAERAAGVGGQTVATILTADCEEKSLAPTDLQKLRQLWRSRRRPRIPASALRIIDDAVTHGTSLRQHMAWVNREMARLEAAREDEKAES